MEKLDKTSANEAQMRALQSLGHHMGQQLLSYMQDPDIFEVRLNPDSKIWIDTFSRGQYYTGHNMNAHSAKQVMYEIAALTGQVIHPDRGMLQAEIPDSYLFDSSRFQGMLPPVTEAPAFAIRKHGNVEYTLDDYLGKGIVTPRQKEIILQAIYDEKNIIIAGGTKSGKTTFVNAILTEISKIKGIRVVIMEDTAELRCTNEDKVSLRTTPEVSLNDLLRITLRLSPNRIVVGEIRGNEALTLLDAWSTGHRGGCSTVHSDSAYDTLSRLEGLVSRVSLTPQHETVGRAIDMVVYLKYQNLKRYVEDIIFVNGYDKKRGEYIIKHAPK